MLEVVLICATYFFTPTQGPSDRYELWLDGAYYASLFSVSSPNVEVCVNDDLPHAITIKAFDVAGNMTDVDDPSLPRIIHADRIRNPLPINVKADLDGDGIAGFTDFGLFIQGFGSCNKDLREVPCG